MTDSLSASYPTTASEPRQVSENQCHMCMPIGSVAVFKGIENSMVLVHGSQGCSTYMRLTNVEHFNEPVDIASSSLNEKQTIYGGEANLKKALDNVIRVYRPSVLGVLTTCLSETMGEDLERIVGSYKQERNVTDVDIISINTPSYSGTQSEGFWAATRGIIAYYARPTSSHRRINVIVPHISPADIREIKRLMDSFGLTYTLIPDYSLTLDRPFKGTYQKIPSGGTSVKEVAEMPGAPMTIQFGTTCPDALSPGQYLEQEFGVPLINLPLPIGLKNTDLLIKTLIKISGQCLPETLDLERGWLLDGMADAHKFNADARPVIFGEPELVYGFSSICAENGATPSVIASGTKTSLLADRLSNLEKMAFESPVLLEGSDIAAIEEPALLHDVNVAIGHSGGKSLTERHGIPLIRVGFPITDRMGGQRILSVGYQGALMFLDRLTNTLLEAKYATYRRKIKDELWIPKEV